MYIQSSSFTDSTLNLYHNALKSFIFRLAELLLALAVYKFFSLAAARADLFTSYLMFAEDYIQRAYFCLSRAFTRNSVLILCFSVLYAVAQLYGTLLWALDAPGYLFLQNNVTASSLQNSLLDNPAYIVNVIAKPDSLSTLSADMPRTVGSNLFQAGTNFTLTTAVERGSPQTVPATRSKAFPRIWLDTEGFSVSTDTASMLTYTASGNGTRIPLLDCPVQLLVDDSVGWNCTFNNTFSDVLLTGSAVGLPEVHWDDVSDLAYNSRYISPNRENNIWSIYGQGGGTAAMKQMFQVTKGRRRHTFIETALRATMLTGATTAFNGDEVDDFLKRTWSTNKTEQAAPLLGQLSTSILKAQASGKSFMYGSSVVSGESNITTAQVHWQYLTMEPNGRPLYSLLRAFVVNITLIRSETIAEAPEPFEACDASFQNVAYGGIVVDTDCQGREAEADPQFFGQVDTSAVLIFTGLGDGRSNYSAKALDNGVWEWYNTNTQLMDDLLVSRGFITSVDPNLVTLSVSVLRPAMSHLQLLLVLVALFLAAVSYAALYFFASAHWASSFLVNVIWALHAPDGRRRRKPGYIWDTPDVRLRDLGSTYAIDIGGKRLTAGSAESLDYDGKPSMTDMEFGTEVKGGTNVSSHGLGTSAVDDGGHGRENPGLMEREAFLAPQRDSRG